MTSLSEKAIEIINYLNQESKLEYYSEYSPIIDALNLLSDYEATKLTPKQIECMKAKLPLRNWAFVDYESMSIFGISIEELIKICKQYKEENK